MIERLRRELLETEATIDSGPWSIRLLIFSCCYKSTHCCTSAFSHWFGSLAHYDMKKAFKPQASSARSFGGSGFGGGFGGTGFGVSSSPLSWIGEPPDLSNISDPNVGVAFKNLTKKDSTTKTKALEDLQQYVSVPDQQIEEPVLEAWVCPHGSPSHRTAC